MKIEVSDLVFLGMERCVGTGPAQHTTSNFGGGTPWEACGVPGCLVCIGVVSINRRVGGVS